MPMNKIKGNMYEFISHTWNPIKGECDHNCSYCYMHDMHKRFKMDTTLRLDEKELKTNLGSGNTIFVGSSTDIWTNKVTNKMIDKVIDHCMKYHGNNYIFQTKNPDRIFHTINVKYGNEIQAFFKKNCAVCVTLESDIFYPQIMGNTRNIHDRIFYIPKLSEWFRYTMINIEPIMNFHHDQFISMLKWINPDFVSIGADTGKNNLPEPSTDKIRYLISDLKRFTRVHLKSNLKRLLNVKSENITNNPDNNQCSRFNNLFL